MSLEDFNSLTKKEIASIRREISDIIVENGWDAVEGRFGISIMKRAEELPGVYCGSYIFRSEVYFLELFSSLKKISNPLPGAYVFYSFTNIRHMKRVGELDIKHVGMVNEDGTVISKWGNGHVFKHPIMCVPCNYGEPEFFE